MRIHIRWWHAPTEALCRTLKAAGAPAMALADVPAVVQRCVVCRDWAKPGPRNIATFRIILEFNEEAQFDLLFYTSILEPDRGQRTICHLVDACLRWLLARQPRRRFNYLQLSIKFGSQSLGL